MTYELFYGSGGHSGPFHSETEAYDHAAKRQERYVLLCARSAGDARSVGGYLPLQLATFQADCMITQGVALLPLAQVPRVFHHLLSA